MSLFLHMVDLHLVHPPMVLSYFRNHRLQVRVSVQLQEQDMQPLMILVRVV
jgi:hypothetical protein